MFDRNQASHIRGLTFKNIIQLLLHGLHEKNFPVHLTFPCNTKSLSEQVKRPNIHFFIRKRLKLVADKVTEYIFFPCGYIHHSDMFNVLSQLIYFNGNFVEIFYTFSISFVNQNPKVSPSVVSNPIAQKQCVCKMLIKLHQLIPRCLLVL